MLCTAGFVQFPPACRPSAFRTVTAEAAQNPCLFFNIVSPDEEDRHFFQELHSKTSNWRDSRTWLRSATMTGCDLADVGTVGLSKNQTVCLVWNLPTGPE